MALDRKQVILGLTGSFGSGCSTLGEALSVFDYKRISLSVGIKYAYTERIKRTGEKTVPIPARRELQDLGNELRREKGHDILARLAEAEAEKLNEKGTTRILFDGIRHAQEVDYFRSIYPNFYLLTVWCPQNLRWDRVKDQYKGDYRSFSDDDKRDSNEDVPYGQQVQLCVDTADIVIRNDSEHRSQEGAVRGLQTKIKEYVEMLEEKKSRPPSNAEVAMAIAYASSQRSLCLKRQVGAVITDANGTIISTGYNENPPPMAPCFSQFRYCYKDDILQTHIADMVKRTPECPHSGCRQSLAAVKLDDNFKCPFCKKSLVWAYMPDRAMSRCTAIHAEDMAIMNASGKTLKDAVLYTTTFPCAQCGKKIAYAGIKKVIYIEPYPDPDSVKFLVELAAKEVIMFEGVKARAYEKVFNKVRSMNEKECKLPTLSR